MKRRHNQHGDLMKSLFLRTSLFRGAIVAVLAAFIMMTGQAVGSNPPKKEATQNRKNQGRNAPMMLFVLFHTPGPNWVDSLEFRRQPGIMDHVDYMATFMADGRLVMGGPFLDNSGGMMVLKVTSMQEAETIAMNDPTVRSGLLKVNVKPWMPAMSTVEIPEGK
jgi:uncharacterized protein YciI